MIEKEGMMTGTVLGLFYKFNSFSPHKQPGVRKESAVAFQRQISEVDRLVKVTQLVVVEQRVTCS